MYKWTCVVWIYIWRDRDAGPKHCNYCQTSRSQSPRNPFAHGAACCWLWLHHPPVVRRYSPSSPLKFFLTPPSPPPFFSPLTCTRVTARAIIIYYQGLWKIQIFIETLILQRTCAKILFPIYTRVFYSSLNCYFFITVIKIYE